MTERIKTVFESQSSIYCGKEDRRDSKNSGGIVLLCVAFFVHPSTQIVEEKVKVLFIRKNMANVFGR